MKNLYLVVREKKMTWTSSSGWVSLSFLSSSWSSLMRRRRRRLKVPFRWLALRATTFNFSASSQKRHKKFRTRFGFGFGFGFLLRTWKRRTNRSLKEIQLPNDATAKNVEVVQTAAHPLTIRPQTTGPRQLVTYLCTKTTCPLWIHPTGGRGACPMVTV